MFCVAFKSIIRTSQILCRKSYATTIVAAESHLTKWQRMKRKMGFLDYNKTKMKLSSYKLYGCCTDPIDHSLFFKCFSLPDTFNSWFLVTELHVWMVLVRLSPEGREGKRAKKTVVEAMWCDASDRVKAFETVTSDVRKKALEEYHEQFLASVVLYDEGLLTSDMVLAGNVWQRFFHQECDDPEQVEAIVSYIRRSIHQLDKVGRDELFVDGHVSWPPLFEDHLKHLM